MTSKLKQPNVFPFQYVKSNGEITTSCEND